MPLRESKESYGVLELCMLVNTASYSYSQLSAAESGVRRQIQNSQGSCLLDIQHLHGLAPSRLVVNVAIAMAPGMLPSF